MRVSLLILLLAAAPAHAADDDAAALSLADKTPVAEQTASDWRVFTEGVLGESTLRNNGRSQGDAHLFLDAHYDGAFAQGWRAVFADLLDLHWRDSPSHQNAVNTLIDAYVSWQMQPDRIGDLGRINTRYGAATAYNPTDYFRVNAIRSIISIDPASLRENRLGSVMVRGQALWSGGSLTALYSPKLADRPNASALNPDLGATNFRDRWVVALGQELATNFNPQFLVYGQAGQSPQVGVNLTTLVNASTVAYLEYSGGRSPSLFTQALMLQADDAFRSRLATGLTYTTESNLSLTAEYQYSGAGFNHAGWDAIRSGPPAIYAQYRAFASRVQDPPTTRRVFLNAKWQDALINHLDLSAFANVNLLDSSRQFWAEARYHWTHVDAALQRQLNSGAPGSEYGALPARHTSQLLLTYFF
jgi:hypothetical protein